MDEFNMDELNTEDVVSEENAEKTENQTGEKIVYVHDENSFNEIKEELASIKDLFTRRLMNDKQKAEMIQTITAGANFAFIEPFLYDLILVIDRIEDSEDDMVLSICDELLEILERRGVDEITVKKEFDPKLCKAVKVIESEEVESLQVSKILRKGYTYAGRVIRPAEVVVLKPAK